MTSAALAWFSGSDISRISFQAAALSSGLEPLTTQMKDRSALPPAKFSPKAGSPTTLPDQQIEYCTSLSFMSCGGCAPAFHQTATSFLISFSFLNARSTSSGNSLSIGTPAACSANGRQ